MTVYNRERYLATAIESVLQQTRQDFELLIWDDGSTDCSREIAQEYAARDSRIRTIAAEHSGQTQALGAAIAETTGSYIGLLDSDDALAPTALADTTAVLDTEPNVGLVYTQYLVMDAKGKVGGLGKRCQIPYSPERLLVDLMIFHFRIMRRSAYEQVGGFAGGPECAQDYDLCLRLSEVTEIRQVKKPLYYYRIHDKSISCQRQFQQIMDSQQAVLNALERRGLSQTYDLKVSIFSQFSLRQKPD